MRALYTVRLEWQEVPPGVLAYCLLNTWLSNLDQRHFIPLLGMMKVKSAQGWLFLNMVETYFQNGSEEKNEKEKATQLGQLSCKLNLKNELKKTPQILHPWGEGRKRSCSIERRHSSDSSSYDDTLNLMRCVCVP